MAPGRNRSSSRRTICFSGPLWLTSMNRARTVIAQEAARIVCDELITDYGQAKRKAAERAGAGAQDMPENALIQQAVIEYQQLFGGTAYLEHLRKMRATAVLMLRWLAEFAPHLVGATISGAVTRAHRVQLHLFADKPEMLDIFLHNQSVRFTQGERSYRYPNGREARVPLACFEVNDIGVDAAVFPEGEAKRPPVNPADGLLFKRLTLAETERLSVSPTA